MHLIDLKNKNIGKSMNITEKQYHGLSIDSNYWNRLMVSFGHGHDLKSYYNGDEVSKLYQDAIKRNDNDAVARYSKILRLNAIDLDGKEGGFFISPTLGMYPYEGIFFMTEPAIKLIDKIKLNGDNGILEVMNIKVKAAKIILDKNSFFCFEHNTNENILTVLYSHSIKNKQDENLNYVVFGYNTKTKTIQLGDNDDDRKYEELFRKIVLYLFYTDKETEFIGADKTNGKSKKNGKIKNSTKQDLVIVDSKWNVDVIRNEGFDVSGHFRLQPYGSNDNRNYRIIYIEPYIKNGYKRIGKKNTLKNVL